MRIYNQIKQKLEQQLSPSKLEIIDESAKHHGHLENSEEGETHFKITIVSEKFSGLSRIDQQKLVYKILSDELKSQIHALSLKISY